MTGTFHFQRKEVDSISDFIKQMPEEKPDSSGQPGPKSARKKQAAPGQKTETAGPSSRLRFEDEGKPDSAGPDTSGQVGPKSTKGGKLRQENDRARPSERLRREGEPPPGDKIKEPQNETGPGEEGPAGPKTEEGQKTEKAKARADKAGEKLGRARAKLDAQKPPKDPGLPRKLARHARTGAWIYVHNKIHEVEHENVGTEGAHKSELVAEAGIRKVSRFAKRRWRTRHARSVVKWEKKEIRANADYAFRQMAQEHPELTSNPLSRYAQKWKLKREYAKRAREAAKQGAKAAEKTAVTTEKLARRVFLFVKRHPVGVLIVLAVLLVVMLLVGALSSLPGMIGSGAMNAVLGTSYGSEDSDLLGADTDYTALETALQNEVANIESTHSGYDEYRYHVDELGHNPYELASYLTARFQSYTRAEVQGELQAVFDAQYKLTLTETVETRTYTDEDGDEHEYDWYILTVTLTNRTLPLVINERLTDDQKELYSATMWTKGNKPYLWDNIYTGGDTDPGPSYEIPGEALTDPDFAALIAEAEKYLGYPYVWGGSSPSTSFDCSGFVCWVYTHSGVYNLPRTTATGIYNQCAIVPRSEARPGDLIFFTRTYASAGPVSHVGIYVGDNMMIHCGDPIKYASISTSYWQEHFYAFGRLN
ncbi:NlpC/P60 family protein [[Clostridium] methylpentosum DSM 5476]|uniref:NlpC/P60 family protein n=1 Tax=[Clostridium] methylpentosum DSM 5476 TaxID=537013 RepID=C0EI77_9FIRM|nr:NlpC/P60 family protein [[Clostridium] methylpentosum DSM 5476]